MSGFSLSLKSGSKIKKKSGPKRKKAHIFGETFDTLPSEVKITELEEYKESEKQKLSIKPVLPLQSDLALKSNSNDLEHYDADIMVEPRNRGTSNFEDAPEMTKEEEYEEMPVEEFGAALLRGMGWDEKYDDNEDDEDTSGNSKKTFLPHEKARPDLLGIGAKPSASRPIKSDFMPLMKVEKKSEQTT